MKRSVWITFVAFILFLAGCSSKNLYTKPSVFIKTASPHDNNSSVANKPIIYCLDVYSELQISTNSTRLDEYGNCNGYFTMGINGNYFETNESNISPKNIAKQLLFLSDRNCVTFRNGFYFNDMLTKAGTGIINLNLSYIGSVNLGEIRELSTAQLIAMNRYLDINLDKRNRLRTQIIKKIDEAPKYDLFSVLDDITVYDSLCSLTPTSTIGDISSSSRGDSWIDCDLNINGGKQQFTFHIISDTSNTLCLYDKRTYSEKCESNRVYDGRIQAFRDSNTSHDFNISRMDGSIIGGDLNGSCTPSSPKILNFIKMF